MLTGGTGRTGERNVGWKNRVDWRGECCLEEQSGLESGMLIGGTMWTGERNVDWRNRAADPVTRRKAALSVLQGTAFCHLTVCTAVLLQYHAAQCCLRNQHFLREARISPHFWNQMFITTFTTACHFVSIQFIPPHTI